MNKISDDFKCVDINAKQFLDVMFADIDPHKEVVCVSKGFKTEDGMGFWNVADDNNVFTRWKPEKQRVAWYVCVSSCDGEKNVKGTAILRKTSNVVRYHFLMLDDIGTKATPPPVEPTAKIETSTDNFQYDYALIPGEDFKRYEALIEYCHEQGWGDGGAGGCYRICRIPGSANIKPGRDNFKSRVTEWNPDKVWTLDDLAIALGCENLDERATRAKGNKRQLSSGTITTLSATVEVPDPLYTWLADNGHIVTDDGASDFIDILCPWREEHSSGSDTAGYSPLGRGEGDWVQARGFRCLHEHCKGRGFRDFMKEMGESGAPRVSGVDPLPWLQHRYTYIGKGARVADLHQRPKGGEWIWDLEDWAKMNKGRVIVPGRDTPVEIKTAFLEHKNTTKTINTKYCPVRADEDVTVFTIEDQELVNTYVPPNHPETDEPPLMFQEHMDYLMPDDFERELFVDWLASKVQEPASRSYAMVLVAEDAFGIGRSWIKNMLSRTLQGKVNTASLGQLVGKGTSAENNYNDWKAECQFVVVEEAKDEVSREVFYQGYEKFKQLIDTRVGEGERINPKYGRTRTENIYFNALIFSNHADALAIPENDRRVCVITTAKKQQTPEYYDRLADALTNGEAKRLYWFLMRRDLSNFDMFRPPMTPGKSAMIEQNRSPSNEINEYIMENCEGDIFTKKMFKSHVVKAAIALDYDNIVHKPGATIRNLWGKLGKLREKRHGARYSVDKDNTEIRAIRNIEKWKQIDANRDRDAIEAEYLKNDKSGGRGLKVVK
jgi:hypothetical protein